VVAGLIVLMTDLHLGQVVGEPAHRPDLVKYRMQRKPDREIEDHSHHCRFVESAPLIALLSRRTSTNGAPEKSRENMV
jgi:hypothetical protein